MTPAQVPAWAAAGRRAQAVVGRYGDQSVAWSVLLGVTLDGLLDPALVAARLSRLCRRHPHLGAPPVVRPVPSAERLRGRFATTPYETGGPLLRVAVGTGTADLLIAGHHGAVDGLGLVAVLGAILDSPARTDATGLGPRPARTTFAGSAVRRLGEALFVPPARLHRVPGSGSEATGADEVLLRAELPFRQIGSAALIAAAGALTSSWNAAHGVPAGRVVAAVGACRTGGGDPCPEHRALLLRLRLPADSDPRKIRELLATQPPEPDFPPGGGVARLAVRVLANRLGATFLASNLGVLSGATAVRSAAFHPVASGPGGVAFGAVSTAETTTVTLRTRRRDFTEEAAAALLAALVAGLPANRSVRVAG